MLKPGESYTQSATFAIPTSISGNFNLIVKADTGVFKDFYAEVPSTIRTGLPVIRETGTNGVLEFKDEANNTDKIALPITLATPPDLQVTSVTAPEAVIAGQNFTVAYKVENLGGKTPVDQGGWYDMVYLSKDRFLDLNKDRYLGYVQHSGGLIAGGSYTGSLTYTAPRDLEGPYYVFVVTDPARIWGSGDTGQVLEFGKDDNNNAAAIQPMRIETPPPADLVVTNVVVPGSAKIGDEVEITFTIQNTSINPAYGRWTDALYLSADNAWDLNDIAIGKVAHVGDLGQDGSYTATLKARLPALKDGSWRVIVRPDLYNEVFEGRITYTDTGLNLPPGEANNRTASGATLRVEVPTLTVGQTLATTLSTDQTLVYKVSVGACWTRRPPPAPTSSTCAGTTCPPAAPSTWPTATRCRPTRPCWCRRPRPATTTCWCARVRAAPTRRSRCAPTCCRCPSPRSRPTRGAWATTTTVGSAWTLKAPASRRAPWSSWHARESSRSNPSAGKSWTPPTSAPCSTCAMCRWACTTSSSPTPTARVSSSPTATSSNA
jgi:hypothetical protein